MVTKENTNESTTEKELTSVVVDEDKKTSVKKKTHTCLSKTKVEKLEKDFKEYKSLQNKSSEKMLKSINTLNTKLDTIEKKFGDIEKKLNSEVDKTVFELELENIKNLLSSLEEDIGDNTDKLDMLFVGEDNSDIQSRISKLESCVYGRLHTKNA